jgi:hypothetical protein
MSNGQVIRAAQMFVKQGAGASKGVNLKAEMAMGLTLGIGVGLTWKVYLALDLDFSPSQTHLEISVLLSMLIQNHDTESDCCLSRCTTGTRRENKQNTTPL